MNKGKECRGCAFYYKAKGVCKLYNAYHIKVKESDSCDDFKEISQRSVRKQVYAKRY